MAIRGSPRFIVLAFVLVILGLLFYSARDKDQIARYTSAWTYGYGDTFDSPELELDFPLDSSPAPVLSYLDDSSQPLNDVSNDLDPFFPPPSSQSAPLPPFCDYCGPTDKICQRYGPFNLARSRAYEGPNTRLKRIVAKARSGHNIRIGVIGGSVTKGHGVSKTENWTYLYGKWWEETFGIEVEVINGGVGATVSDYMDSCFHEHIPDDVDLVVIELAINDQRLERLAEAYNNLIRGLFHLPNQPAVINLQIMALSFATITMGGDLHLAVAQYYDTPIVSVRNMLLPHILQTTGVNSSDTSVTSYWFHHNHGDDSVDLRHMNFNGHRLMADLLASLTGRAACEGYQEDQAREQPDYSPWLPAPEDFLPMQDISGEYVPRISLFDKYETDTFLKDFEPSCMTTTATKHPLVTVPGLSHDFEYWTQPTNQGKIFLRATKPGAVAAFKLKTNAVGRMRVTYLRSKDYGLGSVSCWADDLRSKATRLDGYWTVPNIHTSTATVVAKDLPPGEHLLTCELLKETNDPGKGTDFRIVAVDAA